jgi:hypothetical protein
VVDVRIPAAKPRRQLMLRGEVWPPFSGRHLYYQSHRQLTNFIVLLAAARYDK